MEVENVARVGFTSRRTTKQQGDLTISPGLFCQVIIDDEGVFTAVAEVFAHCCTGIRCNVLHSSRFRCGSSNNNGVFQCAVFFEFTNNVSDRGSLLTDSNIDTGQIFAFLVDDRVDSYSSLTCLSVANDQLTLAAADRNHGVNRLQTCLNRLANGLTFNNARSNFFNNVKLSCFDRAFTVNRLTQGVNNAAFQCGSDGNLQNAAGSLNDIAFGNMCVVAQNNGTDGISFKVKSKTVCVIREFKHFALHHVRKTMNTANTVGNGDNRTFSAKVGVQTHTFDSLLQQLANLTRIELHSFSTP